MILNINKPIHWTSSDVVKKIKSNLNIKKVGHAGTLDPLATGVLIILTDEDTKRQSSIMQMPKEYTFEMVLGVTSKTYDMEGPFSFSKNIKELNLASSTFLKPENIKETFLKYKGKIMQQVPVYSAVKVKGRPLYKFARSSNFSNSVLSNPVSSNLVLGQNLQEIKDLSKDDLQLPIKEVEIYDIEILNIIPKREIPIMGKTYFLPHIKARVSCGSGTYIRSLAHDIGCDLGFGATITELTRTKIGPYLLKDSIPIPKSIPILKV